MSVRELVDDGVDWSGGAGLEQGDVPVCCVSCAGPVDPFTAGEVGLVLHRTVRIDVSSVDWQKTRLSMNDRLDKHTRARRTRWWRQAAALAGRNVPGLEWGRVVIFFRFPTNHRREVNNLMPTSKAIVDGLVDAGVFPDDNDKHVLGPDNRRESVNGPHQVVVRLYRRV